MPTLIWIPCIVIAWAAASGDIAGYDVEVDDQDPFKVIEAEAIVCLPDKYTLIEVRVRGFNADWQGGEWSDPLVLERVHDFDACDTGVANLCVFGRFMQDFGMTYDESGVAVPR